MLNDEFLLGVRKPARYIGSEWNVSKKSFDQAAVRFALCFPDMYEVGMSNLGIRIIYSVLNTIPDVCCERVFVPDIDMAQALRDKALPLFSLESQKEVRAFDILGFSLGYELSYTNVLSVLDLAGIPLEAASRGKEFPLIIAGGPAVMNPEPMHEFIDLFVIGEAEEAMVELIDVYRAHKADYLAGRILKADLLAALCRIEGVYVPSFYDVSYNYDQSVKSYTPNRAGVPATVKKRVLPDLNALSFPRGWIVPYIQIIHDRLTIEVSRGCPNRCRFCQGRSCYFPVRYRKPEQVLAAAREYYRQTGYDEISLAGLSVSDYPDLPGLMEHMVGAFKDKGVSISLPSVKPKTFLGGMSCLIATVKKTGLTFAPEAATDRLRKLIGKDFDEAEFFRMLDEVYRAGYQHVKLYFMVGLPQETDADIEAIADFSRRVSSARKAAAGSGAPVNVSVNTVIPKPHTPFQWVRMYSLEQMQDAQRRLLSKNSGRKIKISFHDRSMNFLEGVFSRGDRRLSAVIKAAYAKGCRFDGWSEHFKFESWMDAFRETAMDPAFYLRQRRIDECLPWDFIDAGIPKQALIKEYQAMERSE
ncbi:MAG: TIGR03960 family B12-binding radical SAM protein [Candidatus Omnitrophota bacterium]